ncbi:MAG: HAD hydrolase-like protein [Solirubrobacteraceae bacterium]
MPDLQLTDPDAVLTDPDAVLFDLDGTLIDSRTAFVHCMNHALTAVGLAPRTAAELHDYLGPPIHETLTDHMRVPGELVHAIVSAYRERYAVHGVAETAVYPGIVAMLELLHGHVRLAVATSKPGPSAAHMLHELGLDGFFEAICGPGLEAVNESKAVTVGRALETLAKRAALTRAVMVGDRLYDVLGARQHGLPTIGVLWGFGSEAELRAAGAAALVATPAAIPALIGL